jgi:hypothetical protein
VPTPISTTEQQAFYNQQSSTDVLAGCASLGVDLPIAYHQALLDQHGQQYPYSATTADPQYTPDSQYSAMDGAMADWFDRGSGMEYWYTWMSEDLGGDLAGTGAQFDASMAGWKSEDGSPVPS